MVAGSNVECDIKMFLQASQREIVSVIFIIYQNHHWMMSVKRPHEEVTIGHLENKTKFNNTGETSSALQKGLAT